MIKFASRPSLVRHAQIDCTSPPYGSIMAEEEVLKAWRRRQARALDVPAYRILTNKTIEQIANCKPQTMDQLGSVKGIGPYTLDTYGREILDILGVTPEESTPPQLLPCKEPISLTNQQLRASTAIADGENVFLTGPGGTGKSAVVSSIVEREISRGKKVQVCAMTGCASVQLYGCKARTLHAWAGLGRSSGLGDTDPIIDIIAADPYKSKNWKEVDLLVVDEVSMLSKDMFDTIDEIAKTVRDNGREPFGGIQLLFCGDFYQLPPVGDTPGSRAFCFESKAWSKTFDVQVVLDKIFRQADARYTKILNQVRCGRISKRSIAVLRSRVGKLPPSEAVEPTLLSPKRHVVERVNKERLEKLSASTQASFAVRELVEGRASRYSAASIKYEMKQLMASMRADAKLELREGAQVMCVANIPEGEGGYPIHLVNGSRGIVVGFSSSSGAPIVNFAGHCIELRAHKWESDRMEGVSILQIPLTLAWAITIHKSQGATLESALIDAGEEIFECGQTYVALSRVRDLDGLYLTSFDVSRIAVNRKVREYYASIDSKHQASEGSKEKKAQTVSK